MPPERDIWGSRHEIFKILDVKAGRQRINVTSYADLEDMREWRENC